MSRFHRLVSKRPQKMKGRAGASKLPALFSAMLAISLMPVAFVTTAQAAEIDVDNLPAPELVDSQVCAGAKDLTLPDVDGVTYERQIDAYIGTTETGPWSKDDPTKLRVVATDDSSGEQVGVWNFETTDNICMTDALEPPVVTPAACGKPGYMPNRAWDAWPGGPQGGPAWVRYTGLKKPGDPGQPIGSFTWDVRNEVLDENGYPITATYTAVQNQMSVYPDPIPIFHRFVLPTGTQTVFELDATAEPCPTEVTPIAPELETNPACGVEPKVEIPEVEGVEYTETRDGSTVTITAKPKEGFTFPTPMPDPEPGPLYSPGPLYLSANPLMSMERAIPEDSPWTVDTEWTFEIPEVEPCDVEVTPIPPTLTPPACGVEPKVEIPEVEGVEYTETRDGSTVTITAKPKEGFTFPTPMPDPEPGPLYNPGPLHLSANPLMSMERAIPEDSPWTVDTEWTFEIPEIEECPIPWTPLEPATKLVTPIEPVLTPPTCAVESEVVISEVEGVEYTQTRDGNTVTVTAVVAEDYAFAAGAITQWELEIPEIEECPIPWTPLEPATKLVTPIEPVLTPPTCAVESEVVISEVEGVEYTQTRDGNTVTVTAVVAEGYAFAAGAITQWELEIPEIEECPIPWTPLEPTTPEPLTPEPDTEDELVQTGFGLTGGVLAGIAALISGATIVAFARRKPTATL